MHHGQNISVHLAGAITLALQLLRIRHQRIRRLNCKIYTSVTLQYGGNSSSLARSTVRRILTCTRQARMRPLQYKNSQPWTSPSKTRNQGLHLDQGVQHHRQNESKFNPAPPPPVSVFQFNIEGRQQLNVTQGRPLCAFQSGRLLSNVTLT